MANEKLVSSVYFRGGNVGSVNLDIVDTSIPATYDITIKRNVNTLPNALDVRLGSTISIQVVQNPPREDVPRFWYTLSGSGATKFDLGIMGSKKQPLSGSVSTFTTIVIFTIDLNYYPSLTDINATLDLYHDSAKTNLIASIPIRSIAIPGAKLTVTSVRNQDNVPEASPTGIFNNDILLVKYVDDNASQTIISSIPIVTLINNVNVPSGDYPANNAHWFNGTWNNLILNYGGGSVGKVTIPRQKNSTVSGNVPITITAGDLTVTNTLVDSTTANLIGEEKTFDGSLTFKKVDKALPSDTLSLNDARLSIGYAFVKNAAVGPANSTAGNPPAPPKSLSSEYITSLITRRNNGMEILADSVDLGSLYDSKSKGKVTYLAWNATKLDTAGKRSQFGKYQKTLSCFLKWSMVNGTPTVTEQWTDFVTPSNPNTLTNITMDVIQDPIATSLYGALTSLNFTTLAAFVFISRDASLIEDKYAMTGCLNFKNITEGLFLYYRWLYESNVNTLPTPNPSNPNDLTCRVDLLFIRNNTRSELNTFASDVPYPRFINVQTKRGYEAYNFTTNYATFWDFDLDPSLGIDLTNPRYSFITTVQNDSDWGYELTVPQSVTLVGRSANKVTFRAGWVTSNPSLSLAIVDNGPI